MKALANIEAKHNREKVSQIFGDYLVMLVAPCILAWWFYGARVLSVIAVGILSAMICDLVFCLIIRKKFILTDMSNIFIGTVISLMLPAGVPLYVPAVASVFAVLTAKIPFGGPLKTPFVPSAAGFAFVSVCFKEQVFDFACNASADKMLGARSIGSLLAQGNAVHLNAINVFDILSGNVAGPMGTGCILLMLGCCAYLFVRRRSALLATAGFLAACAVWAMLLPRINASVLTSIVLELSSGSLVFASVFLVTDKSTLPEKGLTKVIYGAVCGIFCMGMRAVGTYEETVCFAILLANGFSPVINSIVNRLPAVSARTGGDRQ